MLKPPQELTTEQQNCLALADFIENGSLRLDMHTAIPNLDCGSAGCIIGHASLLWKDQYTFFNEHTLSRQIGASNEEIHDLCFNTPNERGAGICYHKITKPMAVAALRRFALYKQTHFEIGD